MHIVIAPDSFKESLSAGEAAQAIHDGMARILPKAHFTLLPMADGGEGTAQSFAQQLSGDFHTCQVTGPDFSSITASYVIVPSQRLAIIDVASASGLPLLAHHQRNPLHTTSLGTGELIRAALAHDVDEIIIGLGGSATTDAGAGILVALGAKLLDSQDAPISPTGDGLGRLAHLDLSQLDPRLKRVRLTAACDVDNPLCGPQGAATVFAPQKGASPEQVRQLEQHLHRFASLCRYQLGKSIAQFAGAGAAGGIGATLGGLLGAQLVPGVALLLERSQATPYIAKANWLVTGEGKVDGQTLHGKVPAALAQVAKQFDVPVVVLAGRVGDDCEALYERGVTTILPIQSGPCDLQHAFEHTAENLRRTAENVARLIAAQSEQ
ncbi:glycerate kinase [Salinivibrio costicola]|uniref:Glycerate kinase n=1 Tax=Salinivibrio costicola TaxID=51367 RepID=A0ABX6K181_SALCS|nr:glycerate kinase [Salinivibrio costicola]QIR05332.1 glycerate kinase [Salinivibrio costicola]